MTQVSSQAFIAHIADVHVGNHRTLGGPVIAGLNQRCRTALHALASVPKGLHAGLRGVVIHGDLFDTPTPSPQIVTAVGAEILRWGVPVVINLGNHDATSSDPGDHALGPLGLLPGVWVVDRPTVVELGGQTFAVLPYTRASDPRWILDVLADLRPPAGSTLCLHAGLYDDTMPAYLRKLPALDVGVVFEACERFGLRSALAGDWHKAKAFGAKSNAYGRAIQVGSLLPAGFGEGESHSRASTFADPNVRFPEFQGVAHRAQFSTLDVPDSGAHVSDFLFHSLGAVAQNPHHYLRITVAPAQMSEVRDAVHAAGPEAIARVLLREDSEESMVMLKVAAAAAKSAHDAEEALERYVDNACAPLGLDPAEVLAEAKRFLRG